MGRDKPKAAIYMRVSTEAQVENYSFVTQEKECRAYAEQYGFEIIETIRDTYSGAKLDERTGMTKLRNLIERQEIAAIIAYHPDRLTRDQTHLAVLGYECQKAGVSMHTVLVKFDTSPEGQLMQSVVAFVSAAERKRFRERSQAGIAARLAEGKLRPSNRPRYGYKWDDPSKGAKGRYLIDESQAWVVRMMYQTIADGGTLRGLARKLLGDGIPTINGSREWHCSVIRKLLAFPGYKGVALGNTTQYSEQPRRTTTKRWNDTSDMPRRTVYRMDERPDTEWIRLPANTIPAIVAPELWDAVQERLTTNKREASRNNKNPQDYLLRSGYVFCAACGRGVRAVADTNRGDRPKRPTYRVQHGADGHLDCPSCSIVAHELDNAVWNRIVELMSEPVRALTSKWAADDAEDQRHDTSNARAALAQEIEVLEKRASRLSRVIQALDDDKTLESLIADLQAIGGQKKRLQLQHDELLELEQQQVSWSFTERHCYDLDVVFSQYRAKFETMDYAERRLLLNKLKVRASIRPITQEPRYEIEVVLPAIPEWPFQVVSPSR